MIAIGGAACASCWEIFKPVVAAETTMAVFAASDAIIDLLDSSLLLLFDWALRRNDGRLVDGYVWKANAVSYARNRHRKKDDRKVVLRHILEVTVCPWVVIRSVGCYDHL